MQSGTIASLGTSPLTCDMSGTCGDRLGSVHVRRRLMSSVHVRLCVRAGVCGTDVRVAVSTRTICTALGAHTHAAYGMATPRCGPRERQTPKMPHMTRKKDAKICGRQAPQIVQYCIRGPEVMGNRAPAPSPVYYYCPAPPNRPSSSPPTANAAAIVAGHGPAEFHPPRRSVPRSRLGGTSARWRPRNALLLSYGGSAPGQKNAR